MSEPEQCPKCHAIRTSKDAKYCGCGHKWGDVLSVLEQMFGKKKDTK